MISNSVYFVAVEASGDLLASEVIQELRSQQADIVVNGVGARAMEAAGVHSSIDLSPLSVLGLVEGLMVYRDVIRLADEVTEDILATNPDAVVLVDAWGFMLRVAQRVRKARPDIKLIKLVGPQVWATRPGRAKTLSGLIDHLLCIHEMEVAYYKPYDLPTTVIGNPALSRVINGNGSRLRDGLSIPHEAEIILVLPGSRPSEVKRVAPDLIEAARRLKAEKPDREIVVAPAESIHVAFLAAFPDIKEWAHVVDTPQQAHDAMAAANLALACSGTVTTELATQNTPMLVAYRTGWLTWAVAKGFLYQKTHITLLNITNGDREIVPEFVQQRLTAENVADAAENLLSNPLKLAAQLAAQTEALHTMVREGASAAKISADAILNELSD